MLCVCEDSFIRRLFFYLFCQIFVAKKTIKNSRKKTPKKNEQNAEEREKSGNEKEIKTELVLKSHRIQLNFSNMDIDLLPKDLHLLACHVGNNITNTQFHKNFCSIFLHTVFVFLKIEETTESENNKLEN